MAKILTRHFQFFLYHDCCIQIKIGGNFFQRSNERKVYIDLDNGGRWTGGEPLSELVMIWLPDT